MNRRCFLRTWGLGAAAAALGRCLPAAARTPARQPNIIFFLADDLGWMDSTVYGSRYYETPNIERLAGRGMWFSDAYAASPLCSPTRASIMTGKYPGRLGITTPACHLPPLDTPLMAKTAAPGRKVICPRSRRFLPPEEVTVGEVLGGAGYRTGFFGKWHLGLRPEHWPEEQGFEVSFHGAPDPGPPSYFSPHRFRAGTVTDGPKGEYLTDRVTDEALRYVEKHRREPFFMCLWHWAVHAPFQAKETLVRKYRDKTDPRGKQGCAVMAGMIRSLDESLGRLLDTLDDLRIAHDTVIILFSDNGGNMYNVVEGRPPTNNAPLRGGKGTIYEGGVREPCIVAWPGVVKPGARCARVISSVDWYPTLLEMAGLAPKPGKVLDGVSIVPLLKGAGRLDREAVFCHFPHYVPATGNLPGTSVRKGDWKLIRLYGEGPDRANAYELYNLKDDIGETTNLAERHGDKVRELDALIERHLADTGALVPVPNPNYATRVGNWTPSKDCTFTIKDGVLHVRSTGGDPYLSTADVPKVKGPVEVRLRMRSDSKGAGQVLWSTDRAKRFHHSRSVGFKPQHDGQWHEYAVSLPVEGTPRGVRIDPSTAPGLMEIDWIRLVRADGTVLKAWQFGRPAAGP